MASERTIYKAQKKLVRLATKAEQCVTREQAQKLIKKAEKANKKING